MRLIYPHELPVVRFLFEASGRQENPAQLYVKVMDDGGMGSLKFTDGGEAARYAVTVAACEFKDADGVLVSAVLNLDESDAPFEVDIWKMDFTPLCSWPEFTEIKAAET
ncbi:DUF6984 family protein [Undibacterium sp. TJN25]|uniref:DUF6984 family protein n=1 Tax=Undibacterium sp. TJN25 TaxID=3413056 RepID=UPI003BF13629